ncbi:SAM-dependent chlorinase/fluorinase [Patescibacteria group bacterium]|nr:SAM-dependent chlorinase/fluorinase [Patescibacteria group bacterium]MCL5091848.1 SAM-dependent chlorinase/fluorinase [Patescibacteria group bacterium]
MKKLIVVSDWAGDDLTRQEFRSATEGYLQTNQPLNLSFVAATASTIHTGFLLAQVAEIEERYGRPLETVLFQNTDPRLQADDAVERAKGAAFVVIRLDSGLYLCGPNAGYDFAFIKKKIDKIFVYPGLDQGSQFRSRDLYSRVCAHLIEELEDELELEEAHTNLIPVVDGHYVAHVDNFGNIKTTLTLEDIKGKCELGETVTLKINRVVKPAKYVSNLFGGVPGELVIYPGSSGHKDNPYLEVSVWRHFDEDHPTTGMHEFNHPRPGMTVELV